MREQGQALRLRPDTTSAFVTVMNGTRRAATRSHGHSFALPHEITERLQLTALFMSLSRPSCSSLTRRVSAVLTSVIALGLAACGGGGSGPDASTTGTLRLSLTDAPACGYDNVWVTVEKVRIHASSTAADTDGGWSEVVLRTPQRIDLLTLTNGTLQPLGQTALPAGKYTQMRLVLGSTAPVGSPAGTLPNSIKPTGGGEVEMTTPSALQSGLKMNIDIDVAADKVADFAIDFDACKSFVKTGNSGKYILKPVLSVIPILSDAGQRVVGYVDTLMAGATVSVQQNGVAKRTTSADANGKFVLYPVPPGNYDLVISATGRVIAVMTGVPVVTTGYTDVNTTANRIAPPMSAMRVVAGSITSPVVIDASVKASKVLTGGPTVEVASRTVTTPGTFTFALPVGAAMRAAYVVAPTLPVFTADATVPTGLFTLAASSAAAVRPPVIVDTTTAAPPSTVFAFP